MTELELTIHQYYSYTVAYINRNSFVVVGTCYVTTTVLPITTIVGIIANRACSLHVSKLNEAIRTILVSKFVSLS